VEPAYLKDPAKQTSLRSAISVPLRGQDGVMGALTLYSLRSDAFNQDHLRVLLAIRLKAGLTIENSLRFGHAKTAAENDELTGLLNAGSVFRLLSSEIAASAATHRRVAVLVLDLDGFKVANDLHGHMAGNRILQEVAAGLKQFCRRTDHVARMGGDEFVLVLPDADDLSIAGILGRIHELGPEAGMKTCGERLITISAGVAVFPKDGADAESLLEAADRQMYEAKRSRSNRRVA
jgi:diguanylate cyclase (GGDEF)-like protein